MAELWLNTRRVSSTLLFIIFPSSGHQQQQRNNLPFDFDVTLGDWRVFGIAGWCAGLPQGGLLCQMWEFVPLQVK